MLLDIHKTGYLMNDLMGEPLVKKGFIDLHAHILPGLDDGAIAIEESVEMAKASVADGVAAIVATPHSNQSFCVDRATLDREISLLNDALREERVVLQVYPGAEVRVSPSIFEKLDNGTLQTLANGRYALIEPPFDELPFYMRDLIFNLRLRNMTPVLAHPERTATIQKRVNRLKPLIEQGCLIQINSSSLAMGFGPDFSTAVAIMRKGWAFAIASDAHNLESRPPGLQSALRVAVRLIGAKQAMALVSDNPRHVLHESLKASPE